jgi:hypothetical protein
LLDQVIPLLYFFLVSSSSVTNSLLLLDFCFGFKSTGRIYWTSPPFGFTFFCFFVCFGNDRPAVRLIIFFGEDLWAG